MANATTTQFALTHLEDQTPYDEQRYIQQLKRRNSPIVDSLKTVAKTTDVYAPGKSLLDLLAALLNCGDAEAHAVAPVDRPVPIAVRRTAAPGEVDPATAAADPVRVHGCSR